MALLWLLSALFVSVVNEWFIVSFLVLSLSFLCLVSMGLQ